MFIFKRHYDIEGKSNSLRRHILYTALRTQSPVQHKLQQQQKQTCICGIINKRVRIYLIKHLMH